MFDTIVEGMSIATDLITLSGFILSVSYYTYRRIFITLKKKVMHELLTEIRNEGNKELEIKLKEIQKIHIAKKSALQFIIDRESKIE